MFFKKKSTIAPRQRARSSASGSGPKQQGPSSVFSYHASRSVPESRLGRVQKRASGEGPTAVQKRSKQGWVKRTTRMLAIVAIAILFVGNTILATKNPDVVFLDGTGKSNAFLREREVYQEAARRAFSGSVLNSNKVTIDVKGVEDALQRSFPELADVSVSLPFIGRRPVVHLQPSTARLILRTFTSQSYVLDDNGKVIATGVVTDSLRKAGLPEVQDDSTADIASGAVVLPSTSVFFITEVARQLKAKGVNITSMTLPVNIGELHVRIKDAPYTVKFNLRGDARVESGAYLALKQYLESQKKTPAEYIDVRVENRAYYK